MRVVSASAGFRISSQHFCRWCNSLPFIRHWPPACTGLVVNCVWSRRSTIVKSVIIQRSAEWPLQVRDELLPQVKQLLCRGLVLSRAGHWEGWYLSAVARRELHVHYRLIYIPTLACAHELWVETERIRLRIYYSTRFWSEVGKLAKFKASKFLDRWMLMTTLTQALFILLHWVHVKPVMGARLARRSYISTEMVGFRRVCYYVPTA